MSNKCIDFNFIFLLANFRLFIAKVTIRILVKGAGQFIQKIFLILYFLTKLVKILGKFSANSKKFISTNSSCRTSPNVENKIFSSKGLINKVFSCIFNYFNDKIMLPKYVELRQIQNCQYQQLCELIAKFDNRHVSIIVIFLSKL